MDKSSSLKLFIDRILNFNVVRMGGASAGIFGSTGADYDVLNSLKNSTIAFATEYRKPTTDHAKLKQFSNDIYGYLQTLQLTYTLSEVEANELIDQLQKLTDIT